MTKLTTQEMQQVQGGGQCGVLGAATALSCIFELWVACGIGLVGGALLC